MYYHSLKKCVTNVTEQRCTQRTDLILEFLRFLSETRITFNTPRVMRTPLVIQPFGELHVDEQIPDCLNFNGLAVPSFMFPAYVSWSKNFSVHPAQFRHLQSVTVGIPDGGTAGSLRPRLLRRFWRSRRTSFRRFYVLDILPISFVVDRSFIPPLFKTKFSILFLNLVRFSCMCCTFLSLDVLETCVLSVNLL